MRTQPKGCTVPESLIVDTPMRMGKKLRDYLSDTEFPVECGTGFFTSAEINDIEDTGAKGYHVVNYNVSPPVQTGEYYVFLDWDHHLDAFQVKQVMACLRGLRSKNCSSQRQEQIKRKASSTIPYPGYPL